MTEHGISMLPPEVVLETQAVLKALASAPRYLAALKRLTATIPDNTF